MPGGDYGAPAGDCLEQAEDMVGKEVLVMIEGKVADENAYGRDGHTKTPLMWTAHLVNRRAYVRRFRQSQSDRGGRIRFDRRVDIMNLPNKLTVLRVIMVPFFVLFMLTDLGGEAGKWIALVIFCLASLTDMLDGKIARARNLVTNFGKFMDPLADKLLVCSAMICLIPTGQLPAWVVIVIIAREFIISGFRLVASDSGIVIAASYWGKFKTVSQMLMVIVLIADLGGVFDMIGTALIWIALILTVVSLVDYIAKNVQVLTKGGM